MQIYLQFSGRFCIFAAMSINEKTREFINKHVNDDVRKLALQGVKDEDVDLTFALQQIAGRQMARQKLPSWAAVEDIVYPPHLNMEQCSSEQTARYKAKIAGSGESFVDLTGGFGVDFYWMSQGFKHRHYVEKDEALCAISTENFRLLGLSCSVNCESASTCLSHLDAVDLIYLDPARRNEYGGRTYSIEDCTPNVLELLPLLMQKANRVMLKLSPMLDWRKAVEDIQKPNANSQKSIASVSEVHIVSVDNECKELLLVLEKGLRVEMGYTLFCVNNESIFKTDDSEQNGTLLSVNHSFTPSKDRVYSGQAQEPLYLYEPNASMMKAGCFTALEQRYPVCQVAMNSHLFLSSDEIDDFPGRKFQVQAISSMNKQELKEIVNQKLTPMERANISVRNFPLTVDQLRKKLKLKDGGDVYIFATTLADGQHRLFICRKIG